MEERLYKLLMQENEITWQTILLDLIKTEGMNPWDVDISRLSQKYIQTLKEMKDTNFFISGKMVLAAALLLKLKTNKLVHEDICNFDHFLFNDENEELEDFEQAAKMEYENLPKLTIKTPQKRRRKVSMGELMGALNKALKVDRRRTMKRLREQQWKAPELPERKVNLGVLIKDIYQRILGYFNVREEVTFTKLTGESDRKEDKLLTFVSLLHLDNQKRIDISQNEHFGEIFINKSEKKVLR